MNLPSFLQNRPAQEAENAIGSTSVIVLSAFEEAGAILSTELEYGFEDLPLLATLAGLIRDEAHAWHVRRDSKTDFRVLQRGFVQAFLAGLDVAVQLHNKLGEGIKLDSDLSGILDGARTISVQEPMTESVSEFTTMAEGAFVDFQNKLLAVAASTKNDLLLGDIYACGCLWSALAGVEAGLTELDPPAAA
ncbi:MAG: hypothetical protein RL173_792 [Fibrobacterota bacterium]|jgi:hypothetical protein